MSKNTNLSFLTDYITADITNGRIGINNASPTVAFDVSGITKFSSSVTAADLIISDTYLNDPLIKLVTTTSGNVEVQIRTATTTYNAGIGVVTSGYDFGLFTNNTTRMNITSIGAVAIGATAITDPYTATGGGWQTVQFGKGGILGAYRTDNESMTGFNTYVATDGSNKAIISSLGGTAIRYYEDRITFNTLSTSGTAQTQTERMRITSDGFVGIGTTTPDQLLSLRKTSVGAETVALALQNIGGTAGTAVSMVFCPHESSATPEPLAKISAIRMVAVNAPTDLAFYTYSSGLGERMRITSGGNVGVNTSTNYDFGNAGNRGITLNGNTGAVGYVHLSSNNTSYAFWYAYSAESFLTTFTSIPLLFGTNGTEKMRISANGSIGAGGSLTNIYNASDVRLKKNISTTTYGLNTISALNPVKFNWVDGFETKENGKNMLGFVAQEVQTVIPEAIESFGGNSITIGDTIIDNPLRVNEKFLIPVLVKAIQELRVEIEKLKQK